MIFLLSIVRFKQKQSVRKNFSSGISKVLTTSSFYKITEATESHKYLCDIKSISGYHSHLRKTYTIAENTHCFKSDRKNKFTKNTNNKDVPYTFLEKYEKNI